VTRRRVLWVVHLPSAAECAHVRLIGEANDSSPLPQPRQTPSLPARARKSTCSHRVSPASLRTDVHIRYSTFTVLSSSKDEQGHYVVELQAAACNKLEDESLPSAPWS